MGSFIGINSSLDTFINQQVFTEVQLSARPVTVSLAASIRESIEEGEELQKKRQQWDRDLMKFHARVAVADEDLDQQTQAFFRHVLFVVDHNRESYTFRLLSDKRSPSDWAKLPLRRQAEETKNTLLPALRELVQENADHPLKKWIDILSTHADAALTALSERVAHVDAQSGLSAKAIEYKEGINKLRKQTKVALTAIALEKGYKDAWVGRFFESGGESSRDSAEKEPATDTPVTPASPA